MRKPAQWKVELVKEVSKNLDKSELSAIVSISGIRNNQLQGIRRTLKGQMHMQVMRATLLRKALEKSKKENIKELETAISGQIALVTSGHEPNELYELLETTKLNAPPKGGEVAEDDIIVEPMDTGFPPGPMISEFQKVGLQTAIEKGTINIKKETVFIKAGETISKEKAKILEKLNIKPMRVGLRVIGAVKDGLYYNEEVLSVSKEQILGNMVSAFSAAKAVALNTTFLVPEILPDLIVKARIQAETLALDAGLVDEDNIQIFILKAIKEASALSEAAAGDTQTSSSEESAGDEKEEEQESEKKDEEDVSSGLDALFG